MVINPILEDRRRHIISKEEVTNFSSFSSYHLIAITARTKGEKQLSATDDEDLTIEIDGRVFPKLGTKEALVDSPVSFSGGKLHGLSQTVYFLIFLKGKNHKIILRAEDPPGTATLESLEIHSVNLDSKFDLAPQIRAEDGDRRPWLTFTLVDLPLLSFSVNLNLTRRFLDSDDVKVVVDGEVKRNNRSKLHKLWYFIATSFVGEKQEETFFSGLPKELHYLEFAADRMPFFNRISIDFGGVPPSPQGVPTVDNPKWTENFYDDTEAVLLARAIYGEVGGESDDAKVAVGWSIRNRVEDKRKRWANNYHGVVLETYQYAPFLDPNEDIYKRIVNPPLFDLREKEAWEKSFKAAGDVISGKVPDPTSGANHFFADYGQAVPSWAQESKFTINFGVTKFYKL